MTKTGALLVIFVVAKLKKITMSKDSHFTGQPVYSQVLKLLDKDGCLTVFLFSSLFGDEIFYR